MKATECVIEMSRVEGNRITEIITSATHLVPIVLCYLNLMGKTFKLSTMNDGKYYSQT